MGTLTKLGLAAAGVVALAVVAVLVFSRTGERARIDALFREAARHAEAGDAEKCIAAIARDYDFEGVTYDALCAQVRRRIRPGEWKRVDVRDVDARVDGETAQTTVRLWLEPGAGQNFPYGGYPLTIHFEMKKVAGEWRIAGHRVVTGR